MNDGKIPERLARTIIYESDYVCLYTDKVKLPGGYIIEKYHQIHYPKEETGCDLKDIKFLCSQNPSNGMSDALVHCFAAKVQSEGNISDVDEISSKKWFSKQEYMELLKTNGTKDGVSILAILYALQFNPFEK